MYIDVDIDLDEIYSELNKYDKDQLVKWLQEDGFFPEKIDVVETDSAEMGDKLTQSLWRMSNEDIATIKQILNKY